MTQLALGQKLEQFIEPSRIEEKFIVNADYILLFTRPYIPL